MKHVILGTAGHIDHGKTTLVKALTDIDCDTHKEEKARGITINLGFAYLDLPDGNSVGIVDVPGHSDFVNTMVAGASGIDIVMLVIAADSSVMPQTVEHLRIMEVLGIKKGFVALTKTDLVSDDLLMMAEEEIRELLKETFLDGCRIVHVSVKEGEKKGIEEVKEVLVSLVDEVDERKKGNLFRLFIDRIFTVKGHGTVITGSVLSGEVKKEEKVFLLPVGKELRVRRIERHASEVDDATAGDRASMNLVGLNRDDFERGMSLSNTIIEPTTMLDANLTLFHQNKNFELWNHAIFLLGTFKSQARIHLLDTNKLMIGEQAIVQLHLEQPCNAIVGDRFVLRSTSGDYTLGGGEIIDAHPWHHRRRPEELIEKLQKVSYGGLHERISAEVHKSIRPVTLSAVSTYLNIEEKEIQDVVLSKLQNEVVLLKGSDDAYLMPANEKERWSAKILKNLENFHKRNPINEGGRNRDELIGILGAVGSSTSEAVIDLIIGELMKKGKIKNVGRSLALTSHSVKLSDKEINQIEFVEGFLLNCGLTTPLMSDLKTEAHKRKIDEQQLKQILQLLLNQNKAYNIDGNFIHANVVDKSRTEILSYLTEQDEGITVARFRDLVNGNRKICLLMLSQYDSEGITIRSGDYRLITTKGAEKYSELVKGIS